MSKKTTTNSREGYNKIYESFKNAKNVEALREAVQKSLGIIASYKLDERQQRQLEEFGFLCYERIQNDLRNIEYELQSNNFKK